MGSGETMDAGAFLWTGKHLVSELPGAFGRVPRGMSTGCFKGIIFQILHFHTRSLLVWFAWEYIWIYKMASPTLLFKKKNTLHSPSSLPGPICLGHVATSPENLREKEKRGGVLCCFLRIPLPCGLPCFPTLYIVCEGEQWSKKQHSDTLGCSESIWWSAWWEPR